MEIISIGIGAIGLILALYQTLKTRKVKQLVKDWGSDICEKLAHAQESSAKFHQHIKTKDTVSWGQARADIEFAVEEQTMRLADALESMKKLLYHIVGENIYV